MDRNEQELLNYITVATEVWKALDARGCELDVPDDQDYNFNVVIFVQTAWGPVKVTVEQK